MGEPLVGLGVRNICTRMGTDGPKRTADIGTKKQSMASLYVPNWPPQFCGKHWESSGWLAVYTPTQRREDTMLRKLIQGLTLLTVYLFATQLALSSPAAEEVGIEDITFAGTGCPQGSVAKLISPDRKAFTVLFDNFIAEIGSGVAAEEHKKYCRVTLELDVPQGWSYTLHTVDHRGFTFLSEGVRAKHRRVHWIQEFPVKRKYFRNELNGPFDEDYLFNEAVPLKIISFGCGKNKTLNIDIKIALDNQGTPSEGLTTVDSIDGKLTPKNGISWKPCNNNK